MTNTKQYLIAAAALMFPSIASADAWDTCASNVASYMYSQGMCGASNCRDDNGRTHEQRAVKECGWPKFSEKERQAFIKAAVKDCHPKDGLQCSHAISRQFSLYKPSDPIHKQIVDKVFAKRKKK